MGSEDRAKELRIGEESDSESKMKVGIGEGVQDTEKM